MIAAGITRGWSRQRRPCRRCACRLSDMGPPTVVKVSLAAGDMYRWPVSFRQMVGWRHQSADSKRLGLPVETPTKKVRIGKFSAIKSEPPWTKMGSTTVRQGNPIFPDFKRGAPILPPVEFPSHSPQGTLLPPDNDGFPWLWGSPFEIRCLASFGANADSPSQGHRHQSLVRSEQDRPRNRSAPEQNQDEGAQRFANELWFLGHHLWRHPSCLPK